jgi:hypothetical protein
MATRHSEPFYATKPDRFGRVRVVSRLTGSWVRFSKPEPAHRALQVLLCSIGHNKETRSGKHG